MCGIKKHLLTILQVWVFAEGNVHSPIRHLSYKALYAAIQNVGEHTFLTILTPGTGIK
jgi:hypothetical protein